MKLSLKHRLQSQKLCSKTMVPNFPKACPVAVAVAVAVLAASVAAVHAESFQAIDRKTS